MEMTALEVQRGFKISHVTLYCWRAGMFNRRPIPFQTRPRGKKMRSVFFLLPEVMAWAEEYNLVFTPPDQYRDQTRPTPTTPTTPL